MALLWTPFSLGAAIASGAPAIAGLISAIVAGVLFPLLGGSHVTVSGPAAALAPVLLWGMLLLGQGDLAAGYPAGCRPTCASGMPRSTTGRWCGPKGWSAELGEDE